MDEKVDTPIKLYPLKDKNLSKITYFSIPRRQILCSKLKPIKRNKPSKREEYIHEHIETLEDLENSGVTTSNSSSIPTYLNLGRLRFDSSTIHGFGLFSMEKIKNGESILKVNDIPIRTAVAQARYEKYKASNNGDYISKIFRLDDDSYIDLTYSKNLLRFVNHSCMPNCQLKVTNLSSNAKNIMLVAKKDIEILEELTIDYGLNSVPFYEKIKCNCGQPKCRGYVNYKECVDENLRNFSSQSLMVLCDKKVLPPQYDPRKKERKPTVIIDIKKDEKTKDKKQKEEKEKGTPTKREKKVSFLSSSDLNTESETEPSLPPTPKRQRTATPTKESTTTKESKTTSTTNNTNQSQEQPKPRRGRPPKAKPIETSAPPPSTTQSPQKDNKKEIKKETKKEVEKEIKKEVKKIEEKRPGRKPKKPEEKKKEKYKFNYDPNNSHIKLQPAAIKLSDLKQPTASLVNAYLSTLTTNK